MRLDRIYGMGDRGYGNPIADPYGHRVMKDLLRQIPNIDGHGGGKEQRLPFCRQSFHDLPDVRQKAHIEHAVRLVNDEDLQVGEADGALVRQINQASRTGHGDFCACTELLDLGALVHPAVNGNTLQFRFPSQLVDGLMDLFREAKNEVQESTLASELPDIPIQDLLGDLVSVSRRLGVKPRPRLEPNPGQAGKRALEPDKGGK